MAEIINNNDKVIRYYRCKYCNTTHRVELDKKIADGRSKYPFPYVMLHDSITNGTELREVLTILYIDRDLKIRGAELQEFGEGHLFSKEQVVAITNPLIEEIKILRDDLASKEHELKLLKSR